MKLRKKKKEDTLRQKRLKASEPTEGQDAKSTEMLEACLRAYDPRLGDVSLSSVKDFAQSVGGAADFGGSSAGNTFGGRALGLLAGGPVAESSFAGTQPAHRLRGQHRLHTQTALPPRLSLSADAAGGGVVLDEHRGEPERARPEAAGTWNPTEDCGLVEGRHPRAQRAGTTVRSCRSAFGS